MNSESPVKAPPSSGLDPLIAALLIAASDAEARATGAGRRKQFRITRRLLSAMRKNGASITDLAELLGRTAHSIRDRSNEDGAISASDFSSLTRVPVAQIVGWQTSGQLPSPVAEGDGYVGYPAAALLRTFVASSRV